MSARAQRRRLLVITPDFPPARGGIQVLVHRLAAGLRGLETRVVALDSPGARDFDARSGLATRRVRAPGQLRAGRNVALNALALREALSFRPDVTLSAHIVTSPAAALVRRALQAPTVQYFYAKEIPDKPQLATFAGRRADRSIAISSYTASLMAARGISPARTRLLPPGVDLPPGLADAAGVNPVAGPSADSLAAFADPSGDLLAGQSADPQPAGRPTVVTVARLRDRYKGHDVIIKSLAAVRARVPDVEWVVIGDGPLRAELEALARSCGVADAARFLGSISDEQRDWWLQRADLLAMPSRLPGEGAAGEGFGIVYLEAGAYGKPVVAGNVGGAVDAVADGETGLLVDPTDANAVGSAIVTLLCDRELAARLGRAGAERARSLAWPAITERLETVLFEVLEGAPAEDYKPFTTWPMRAK